jgi:hypothetical protein
MPLSPELMKQIKEEAAEAQIDVDDLLKEAAATQYRCPGGFDPETGRKIEECGFSSPTLAAVCPDHGQHVV